MAVCRFSGLPSPEYRRLFLNQAAVDEQLRCRVVSSLTKERLETDINGDLLGATKRNQVRMDILKLTNPYSGEKTTAYGKLNSPDAKFGGVTTICLDPLWNWPTSCPDIPWN
jgi:hypothetical protein